MSTIKEKIVIYTNETCPYCKAIKQVLDEAKIKYTEKNSTKFQDEYTELTNLTGIPTVPLLVYKNSYFVAGRDYANPQMLVEILKSFKPSNFEKSEQTFEKIKTINYYMLQAFTRLENKLNEIQNKLNTKEDEHKSTD
tara:strand:- start:85 stop:498 length:414 start_codon:yes stop_codon:yes gene_type:complete